MRGKARNGELRNEKTFCDAAEQFEREYQIITQGQRNPIHVKGHGTRLKLHLVPFFANMGLFEITPGQVQEYRIHRHEETVRTAETRRRTIPCIRKCLACASP